MTSASALTSVERLRAFEHLCHTFGIVEDSHRKLLSLELTAGKVGVSVEEFASEHVSQRLLVLTEIAAQMSILFADIEKAARGWIVPGLHKTALDTLNTGKTEEIDHLLSVLRFATGDVIFTELPT